MISIYHLIGSKRQICLKIVGEFIFFSSNILYIHLDSPKPLIPTNFNSNHLPHDVVKLRKKREQSLKKQMYIFEINDCSHIFGSFTTTTTPFCHSTNPIKDNSNTTTIDLLYGGTHIYRSTPRYPLTSLTPPFPDFTNQPPTYQHHQHRSLTFCSPHPHSEHLLTTCYQAVQILKMSSWVPP